MQWESPEDLHPSLGASGALHLDTLEIAGDPHRVKEWLGDPVTDPLDDVEVDWVAEQGTPGVVAAQFSTPSGLVRI